MQVLHNHTGKLSVKYSTASQLLVITPKILKKTKILDKIRSYDYTDHKVILEWLRIQATVFLLKHFSDLSFIASC